jgi:hypothetical protein
MILAQHGTEVSERTLANQADKCIGNVNIETLPFLAGKHGLKADILQLDITAITQWIAREVYPIVYLNRAYFDIKRWSDRKIALSSAIVHAVLAVRCSAHFVLVHDPLHPRRRRLSKKKFEAAQRDLRYWCVVCQNSPAGAQC